MIHLLRQILKDSIDPKTLQSSDRFFKPGEQAKVYGIKMTDVTKIAKEFYKEIDGQPKTQIFELCEQLWQSGYLEEAVIACEWAYSLRKEYAPEDFVANKSTTPRTALHYAIEKMPTDMRVEAMKK